MTPSVEPVIVYSEKEKMLFIHTDKKTSDMIDVIILNSRAETVIRMKLISGSHRIDLSSLNDKAYMVRLVSGDNVWVQKIELKP